MNAILDAGLETITNLGKNIANTLAKTFAKTLFALKVREGEASTLMLSRKKVGTKTLAKKYDVFLFLVKKLASEETNFQQVFTLQVSLDDTLFPQKLLLIILLL